MAVAAPNRIQLFGFQAGRNGFVRIGTGSKEDLEDWTNRLFLYGHGGRSAGKSKGGSYRMLNYINAWPGCVGVVTAPTYPILHDATLMAIREGLDEAGFVRGLHWEYIQGREELQFWNGSLVHLRTTEHPDRLRGTTTAFFWMDEPRGSPYDAYRNLKAGLRQTGFPHQGWFTSTPKGRKHWLYRVWYARRLLEAPDKVKPGDQYIAFPASTLDNPFVGGEVAASMEEEYGGKDSPLYRQEILGEHVIAEGLVYPTWRPSIHLVPVKDWPVTPRELIAGGRVFGGIDFGFRNPACIGVFALDSRDRQYMLDGIYKARMTEPELIGEAKRLQNLYHVRAFACDPADPGWRVSAKRAGIRVVKAMNRKGSSRDTSFGIGACTAVLNARMPDGTSMFFVNPSLQWFSDEIEEYTEVEQIKEDLNLRERPVLSADHAMDVWRYFEGMVTLKGRGNPGRVIKTSVEPSRAR